MAIVLVLVIVFAARLVYVQAIAGPALAQEGRNLRVSRPEPIPAARGQILDANGVVLATTVETFDIRADLSQLPDYVLTDDEGETIGRGALAAADQLISVLGSPAGVEDAAYRAELGADLVGTNGWYLIAAGVTRELWDQVRELGIPGLYAEHSQRREYPNQTVAGSMLGFVDGSGEGAAGLEYRLQSELSGTDGSQVLERGVGGQTIPTGIQEVTPAVPGCDVTLTIDSDLQWHSQQVLDETVETYGAEWGAAVVIEADTGRVLALADSGSGNPNKPGKGPDSAWRLNSVQGFYDPGSTGKVLTVLSALEEGEVEPETAINDPYQLTTPNGQTFTDHSPHPDQVLTVAGVLAQSANTGTINIGSRMSDETRYEYMRLMGWGEPTGIELPNETAGLVPEPDTWDGRQRYTTMFGQGLNVSLLQNTGVFATVANDGVAIAPRLIDSMNCDGRTTVPERPDPVRVVSAEHSREMIRMLESVVNADHGTGKRAGLQNYRVAGKTGTAQIRDRAGGLTDTAASFVGITPAEDPELIIGVVVYRPTSGFYGGTIAAPVFHDIANYALPSRGIEPSTTDPKPYRLVVDDGS
nr:penicillin-binding protein 2 [Pseudactinotalea sp. HY160]